MKALVQKLISTGADLSTKKAIKNTLNYLGIKPENIDKLYIELKNSLYRETFSRIPAEQKFVFLPQCLRKSSTCKAVLKEDGWVCMKCRSHNSCKVFKIKERAEAKGYKVFVVPGGSLVFKIVKKFKPKAALGVACVKEISMVLEEAKIPSQAIPLTKDGCVNTDVNINEVFEVL
jgi:hypothetical protein